MENNNIFAWAETGYDLFAHDGLEGMQVERLARIVNLNKSGFYHYFGDLDGYLEFLLAMHERKLEIYFDEVKRTKTIDPEYLHLLIKYKVPTLFHMQLLRMRDRPEFYKVAE